MCEIDVTCLIDGRADPFTLSHSAAEAGAANSWGDALAIVADVTPPMPDGFDADGIRSWAREFGAWEAAEIAAWSDADLLALVLQYAAGDLRELQALAPGDGAGGIDWTEAERLAQAGTCGGSLYVADDGRLYIYIGS